MGFGNFASFHVFFYGLTTDFACLGGSKKGGLINARPRCDHRNWGLDPCFDPHWSRYSVSTLCGILKWSVDLVHFINFKLVKKYNQFFKIILFPSSFRLANRWYKYCSEPQGLTSTNLNCSKRYCSAINVKNNAGHCTSLHCTAQQCTVLHCMWWTTLHFIAGWGITV